VAKKPFERIGNYLRFGQDVGGQMQGFEFYHEPFEGPLSDNIDLFVEMYESGEPGRMNQGVNLLAQSKDEQALPHLIKALGDNAFTGRAIAAAGLANFPGNKKAFKALIGILKSADFMLTLTAISALGKLGLPGGKKHLRKVLGQVMRRDDIFGQDKSSGHAAIMALSCVSSLLELGDEEQKPLLLRFLGHPLWEVKHAAAKAYARFPDANAEALLRKLSREVNPLLRAAAAEALAKAGNGEGLEILKKLASEQEPAVRASAYQALGSLGEQAVGVLEGALAAETDKGLRLELALRVRSAGRDAGLDAIEEGLADENPFIRQSAIKMASELGGEVEKKMLMEALDEEPDEFLREQICRNLGIGRKGDSA